MTFRLIFGLSILYSLNSNGQINDHEIRQIVLKEDVIDSLFVFGKWTECCDTETHLKYLGKVITSDGRVFKIMNSSWFWGLSHRATCRILIFNDKNEYVGNYPLTMSYDLPDKLENGILIFTNFEDETCDIKTITKIDLTLGLPVTIIIKCEANTSQHYFFSSE